MIDMNVSARPEWLEELADEQQHHLRSQIVQAVRQHCITTNKGYREVWRKVYERFEQDTGITLTETKGTKLDFVQANDRLGDLLKAVRIVTA
jgi:hypothetical protein